MYTLPARKTIRLQPLNYLGYKRYFLTICCNRRQTIFSNPARCRDLLALLQTESATSNFGVTAYCLMPDHLHFLTEGLDPGSNLLAFLKSFKIKTSRRYASQTAGVLWQKGYYEHILHPKASVQGVAWYIWLNPVRRGMVIRPQDYPFSGSFTGQAMPATWCNPTWQPPWKYPAKNGPPQKADPTAKPLWGPPSETGRPCNTDPPPATDDVQ